MKFLICGLGSIGQRHYQNLRSLGFKNIIVYSPGKGEKEWRFKKRYKVREFQSLAEALSQKPDVAFITNPTAFHIPSALEALRANCHLFIEKPISHNLKGVDYLLKLAKKKNKIVFVGYNFRFHPSLIFIKKVLNQKRIGRPIFARFETGEYLPDWHPWEDYHKGYSARADLGGGVVVTQSHEIDCAIWFFGQPKSVTAKIGKFSNLEIDVEDTADIIVEFEKCPQVLIHLDYLQRPPVKAYQIIGSKGKIFWDYYKGEVQLVTFSNNKFKIRTFKQPKNFERNSMYIAELKHFINCLQGRERPINSGEEGKKSLEIALRAKESSSRNKTLYF